MNKKYNDLDKRMKEYEYVTRNYLTKRTPVIIRIDGKSFHSFTKYFKKPFDEVLTKTMQDTTKYLCENIQNCVLGYTQSDEISLLLVDYKNINSQSWFDNNIQKIVSISSSMATLSFNKFFQVNIEEIVYNNYIETAKNINYNQLEEFAKETNSYKNILKNAIDKGAMFDSRVFNLPKEEVVNYFIWRQQDATRNSVQMVGHANFPHKELQNKKVNEIQDMLLTLKNIDFNNFYTYQKRGSCCIKKPIAVSEDLIRDKWIIDKDIPIFTQDRNYINQYVLLNEK